VEFTDLRCPRCRDFERDVFPALVNRYVRPGKLRIERRVIAVSGPDAIDAAAWAAAAARQDRLYQYVDAFFRAEGRPDAAQVASAAGVDLGQARRFASSGAVQQALARTSKQAQAAGIVPPAFYFSMRGGPQQPFPVRSQTPAAFTQALDRLLSR
jgi:protein-disulfide isomerase